MKKALMIIGFVIFGGWSLVVFILIHDPLFFLNPLNPFALFLFYIPLAIAAFLYWKIYTLYPQYATMKEAFISLAIVLFGSFTLYLTFTLVDGLMAKDPEVVLNGVGYIALIVSSIITAVLMRSAYSISRITYVP